MAGRATIPVLVGMMLLTGCSNTLLTKYQDMQCVADCNTSKPKVFEQPVIQTLQMFVGESGCWLVVLIGYLLRRMRKSSSKPMDDVAYQPLVRGDSEDDTGGDEEEDTEGDMSSSQTLVDPTNVVAKPFVDGDEIHMQRRPLTGWKITMLALPAICDILGTTLMNAGLLFVAASIYQMTRGALVLFVGLFSVIFLKRHLSGWKWANLFIVVLGVAVVGLAGALEQKNGAPSSDLPGDTRPDHDGKDLMHSAMLFVREAISTAEARTAAETVVGILMIAGAQIFTATQFVLEESIMEKYSMDPIQVVGWEGQTAAGRGGYFDAREGFYEVFHIRTIGVTSLMIMVSIGGFNFFGLSVTRSISATARSTIDTCRTLFIWLVSLGLGWESFKWLQVLGFALLVYGTTLFNEIVQPPTLAFLRRRRRRGVAIGGNE
ncbi:hypothetical protein B0A55_01860 [Friedmanniomyces simplex]|uniref:EamA domain-containing protein n=1 Tax=Friedmanniomyces simplex TaxID=329884 RepID=A0A4U0XSM9_9PEZI|nr:hypothetical protein B0A55_01860 [Friedmanniomyces simplex]